MAMSTMKKAAELNHGRFVMFVTYMYYCICIRSEIRECIEFSVAVYIFIVEKALT